MNSRPLYFFSNDIWNSNKAGHIVLASKFLKAGDLIANGTFFDVFGEGLHLPLSIHGIIIEILPSNYISYILRYYDGAVEKNYGRVITGSSKRSSFRVFK